MWWKVPSHLLVCHVSHSCTLAGPQCAPKLCRRHTYWKPRELLHPKGKLRAFPSPKIAQDKGTPVERFHQFFTRLIKKIKKNKVKFIFLKNFFKFDAFFYNFFHDDMTFGYPVENYIGGHHLLPRRRHKSRAHVWGSFVRLLREDYFWLKWRVSLHTGVSLNRTPVLRSQTFIRKRLRILRQNRWVGLEVRKNLIGIRWLHTCSSPVNQGKRTLI